MVVKIADKITKKYTKEKKKIEELEIYKIGNSTASTSG